MPISNLPVVGYYNQQRFKQLDPSDTANWYLVASQTDKKKVAMYPSMGRRHIRYLNQNKLIFEAEPRAIYKSVNYWYAVVLNKIYRIDKFFNKVEITEGLFPTVAGSVYFTFIVTGSNTSTIAANAPTFACFTDGESIYVYNEATDAFSIVTDPNAPPKPTYIATFGNRIAVSTFNSSQFGLSEINLQGAAFDPATCFTVAGSAVFAQAPSVIRQFGVIFNTLYIFCDVVTSPWSNIPSTFISVGGDETDFPWKNNSTYNWPYGIADSDTLSIDSDIMAWLGQNDSGLIQPMTSRGGRPTPISTGAIDTLIQRVVNFNKNNPDALDLNADGFLFSYENTLFYRLNFGDYVDTMLTDYLTPSACLDYNFETESWNRCIEVNGQRNRSQKHIYFGNRHLITVQGENTVYEMSGEFYTNDIRSISQADPQSIDAYQRQPMRYERVTSINFEDDYSETISDYVEIDFVFGDTPYVRENGSYENTVFLIDEQFAADGSPQFLIAENAAPDTVSPQYIIAEEGNFPQLEEKTYYNYYKPIIELLFSDDGGVTYQTADVREFSQIGQYRWRMRWYELGTSYFRAYKTICVSPVPLVMMGAVHNHRRASLES